VALVGYAFWWLHSNLFFICTFIKLWCSHIVCVFFGATASRVVVSGKWVLFCWWQWSDWICVQMICIYVRVTVITTIISFCNRTQNGLRFWYWLTQVVLKCWPSDVCSSNVWLLQWQLPYQVHVLCHVLTRRGNLFICELFIGWILFQMPKQHSTLEVYAVRPYSRLPLFLNLKFFLVLKCPAKHKSIQKQTGIA